MLNIHIYSYYAGKHWSKAEGGCEGVNNPEAPIIQPSTIRQNGELYRRYNNQFPLSSTGGASDRARLLVKLDVIKVRIIYTILLIVYHFHHNH